jgi:hypothetical protein
MGRHYFVFGIADKRSRPEQGKFIAGGFFYKPVNRQLEFFCGNGGCLMQFPAPSLISAPGAATNPSMSLHNNIRR